ncbi:MAG: WD40/YVTN/BNR-like repeat-containing protein, partial [Solirubrobacteraceae bacterium]
ELVRTTDGGMTATIVSVSDSALSGVAFTTGSGVVGVGKQGATVLSSDAGQTFPAVSSPGLTGFDATGSLTPGRARGSAYLPGGAGTIAATTDGGADWSQLRVPTGADIQSVAFASDTTGYALDAAGTLRRTTDGGSSWSSFAPSYSPHAGLVAASARALLLVGPRGIRRSTNGGHTFRSVGGRVRVRHGRGPRVATLRLYGASAAGSGIVASGPSGTVVSSDGGRIWRRVATPLSERKLLAVTATSPDRLWALSKAGRLYETTDGGRRWHADDAIGTIGAPVSVSFASREDGLVALGATRLGAPGDFGKTAVLSTRDGGRTWEPQIIDGTSGLKLAATPTADYAEGYYGLGGNTLGFFATTDGGASPLRSTLRIGTAHRSLTRAALARAGHTLVVRGHLGPVLSANEVVALSYRSGAGRWSRPLNVRVATGGGFVVRLHRIRASTEIVAPSLGDGRHGGAGTPVLRVRVRR